MRKATTMALLALLLLLAAGCHTAKKAVKETETHIRSDSTTTEVADTTIRETTDTTIIRQRPTDVELPIPQAHLERETSDTTSVLETDLYRSTATIKDGKLHHTLESLPGATVKGQVTVADTTKIRNQNTVKNSSKANTHNITQTDNKERISEKTIIKWPWWAYTAIAAATAALLFFIYRATRRKH